jgi:hypothetical protein
MTTSRVLNTQNLLTLIHKANLKLKEDRRPELLDATESAISLHALYFRKHMVPVSDEKIQIVKRLRELVE